MEVCGSYGGHTRKSGWDAGLPVKVVPPGNKGAVTLQRQAVVLAGGNGCHTRKSGRDVGLPIIVRAPSHDRAVTLQHQTVVKSVRDRFRIDKRSRRVVVAVGVVSP